MDGSSDIESIRSNGMSMSGEVWATHLPSITALAANPVNQTYCAANEDGITELYDIRHGTTMQVWRGSNFMPVDHLAWSPDGRCIAAATVSGDVTLKTIQRLESGVAWSVTPLQDIKTEVMTGGIDQLLLNLSSSHLLISGQFTARMWSLQAQSFIAESTCPKLRRKWMNHPLDPALLMAVDYYGIEIFSWVDVKALNRFPLNAGLATFQGLWNIPVSIRE